MGVDWQAPSTNTYFDCSLSSWHVLAIVLKVYMLELSPTHEPWQRQGIMSYVSQNLPETKIKENSVNRESSQVQARRLGDRKFSRSRVHRTILDSTQSHDRLMKLLKRIAILSHGGRLQPCQLRTCIGLDFHNSKLASRSVLWHFSRKSSKIVLNSALEIPPLSLSDSS